MLLAFESQTAKSLVIFWASILPRHFLWQAMGFEYLQFFLHSNETFVVTSRSLFVLFYYLITFWRRVVSISCYVSVIVCLSNILCIYFRWIRPDELLSQRDIYVLIFKCHHNDAVWNVDLSNTPGPFIKMQAIAYVLPPQFNQRVFLINI